ncbi:hypothetical protein GX645_01040 [Candidatus Sumerlaeota bacterium]|nr:hypothetical protein [Candidatus Sumerlaeales bacterium]NLD61023.1 hypothetical protein [Candidatus Sumerlaeota bacterium]
MNDTKEAVPELTAEERSKRVSARRVDKIVATIGMCISALICLYAFWHIVANFPTEGYNPDTLYENICAFAIGVFVAFITLLFVIIRNVMRSKNKWLALFLPAEVFDPPPTDCEISPKSRTITILLLLLSGQVGFFLHLFYVKRVTEGLLFCMFTVLALWGALYFFVALLADKWMPTLLSLVFAYSIFFVCRFFYDLYSIAVGTFKDSSGKPVLRW